MPQIFLCVDALGCCRPLCFCKQAQQMSPRGLGICLAVTAPRPRFSGCAVCVSVCMCLGGCTCVGPGNACGVCL